MNRSADSPGRGGQATVQQALVRLCHSPGFAARILAVEVGGSCGRQEADHLSDTDFFLYVRHSMLEDFRARIRQLIEALGTPLVVRGPDHRSTFGFGMAVHYAEFGLVSLLIRDERELAPHYMRSEGSIVLYDPTGRLADVVQRSQDLPVPRGQLRAEALTVGYFRMLQVAKETTRGHHWQARKYYRDVLEQLLVLSRLGVGVDPRGRSFSHSGRAMERDLPGPVVGRFRELEVRSASGISYRLLEDTVALIEDLASTAPATSGPTTEDIDWHALLARTREMLSTPGRSLQFPQTPLQPAEHDAVDGVLEIAQD